MRVLLDTNVVVSALLFGGEPRVLLRALSAPPFELWTSRPLLRELARALGHDKLQGPVSRSGFTVERLTQAYASRTSVVPDAALPEVDFPPDPNDAVVIATARAAAADWLVTGDHHLLGHRGTIPCDVLTITDALARAAALRASDRP
jgi:putative PIN family toxin of toxin-antitoxin system